MKQKYNETIIISEGDEYRTFLIDNYTDFKTKLVSVPQSFQFKVKTQGIPSQAAERFENYENYEDRQKFYKWTTDIAGDSAEQVVYDLLREKFADEPGLLVHGFNEQNLMRVVKENLHHCVVKEQVKKKKKDAILSSGVVSKKSIIFVHPY